MAEADSDTDQNNFHGDFHEPQQSREWPARIQQQILKAAVALYREMEASYERARMEKPTCTAARIIQSERMRSIAHRMDRVLQRYPRIIELV